MLSNQRRGIVSNGISMYLTINTMILKFVTIKELVLIIVFYFIPFLTDFKSFYHIILVLGFQLNRLVRSNF